MAAPAITRNLSPRFTQSPDPLLGRTMVLIAHPDDELACAALLQRSREPLVVIATDGAPNDPYFWSPFETRENYAAIRRQEAIDSLQSIGLPYPAFLNERNRHTHFTDQMLHKNLINASCLLLEIAREFAPDTILAPAYEGGHPDHDACSFLAAVTGDAICKPVWEMPLYHRDTNNRLVCQKFLENHGTESLVAASDKELTGREKMLAAYKSQTDLRDFVCTRTETYRPQQHYDYSRPAHPGLLNYEVWRWRVSGAEVSHCIVNCRTYLEMAHLSFRRALQIEPVRTL